MSATSILVYPLRQPRLQVTVPRPRIILGQAQNFNMPLLTRESLAHRFRQNWIARHPVEAPIQNFDDSLTSLNWLQNLNIMKMATPTPPASPEPRTTSSENTNADLRVNPNAVLNMTNMPIIKSEPSMLSLPRMPTFNLKTSAGIDIGPPTPTTPTSIDKIDYKSNPYVKPPYSYATLICMAMKESKKNKITLAGIYNWITDNFMYYRMADPSWQNSIRHNLSLNKCFQKVPRRKDEPGKGGFWRINPEYSDMFVNGIFKKRRSAPREVLMVPPPKKVKTEPEDVLIGGITTRNPYLLSGYQTDYLTDEGHIIGSDDASGALRGDFNWNAILDQDIEVGGICIKTEDIIDENSDPTDSIACPITTLSPPPSDNNSDIGIEDFLNSSDLPSTLDNPEDLSSSSGSPLDLTIQGATIHPPDWWSESMNKDIMHRGLMSPEHNSGLNTPLASPVPDAEFSHPWSDSRIDMDDAIASFDLDLQNLFDEDLTAAAAISDS